MDRFAEILQMIQNIFDTIMNILKGFLPKEDVEGEVEA